MMEEREARENADIVLCSGTAGEGLPKADLVRMAEMFPDGTDLILVNVPNRDGMIVAAGFMTADLYGSLDWGLEPVYNAVSGIFAGTVPDMGNGLYEVRMKSQYCSQSPEETVRILMRYSY